MSRFRILFASLSVPYPSSNGQRMRNHALLQALAEAGHHVSLLAFAEKHESNGSVEYLKTLCGDVTFVSVPQSASSDGANYLKRMRAFASLRPYGVWRFRSPQMRAAVQERLVREKFHAVICDDVYQIANLPEHMQVPVLLNKHDITHVIIRRYMAHEPNPAKYAYAWAEYLRLRKWEARACSEVATVLACSQQDRRLLEELCPFARVAVVPNVIDVKAYVPQTESDGATLLYFGAMDWYPNQDAVIYFISKIFPGLKELAPRVKFRIAGRLPPENLRLRFASSHDVEFTGTVPNIRSEIAASAVCVVPLRIGSGTRLKILEAAAMAKPIVSTRIGAEGLGFIDGEEIILADEPGEFSRAIAELLKSAQRRRALGQAARRRVEKDYSISVLRTAFQDVLERGRLSSRALTAEDAKSAERRKALAQRAI